MTPSETENSAAASSSSTVVFDGGDTTVAPTLVAPVVGEADGDATPAVQLLEPLPLNAGAPKKRTWFAEWLRSIPTKNPAVPGDTEQAELLPQTNP
jgi:hypothetical protein